MDGVAPSYADGGSDYGSDFNSDDEAILNSLLEQNDLAYGSAAVLTDIDAHEGPKGARVPRVVARERREFATDSQLRKATSKNRISVEIEGYRSVSAPVESPKSRADRATRHASAEPSTDLLSPALKPEEPDLRSPLERFRTKPRKALSVTDLVSPSWCELQYWYVLSKHGRKRRTPAMKQGTAVHKTLEDQVHRTVEVEIGKSEDGWGLRLWNIIQGLRTLRDTGMTRELEVWGVLDGEIINGVIDELSYTCPDRELEEASEKQEKDDKLPSDQTLIENFFRKEGAQTLEDGSFRELKANTAMAPRIYLMDVKTRGVKSVPKGASFRPTLMQLMLYRRLLCDFATNRVDASLLFSRYDLDPDESFSDSFIAQIGNLNEVYFDTPIESSQEDQHQLPPSTQDSIQVLLEHNSLAQLWQLMMEEFKLTMPDGANSIGKVLKAEYRSQTNGEIQGEKNSLYDEDVLQKYIEDEMRWWKGKREAVGVPIEEAYKCSYCEFAEDCSWRKNKIEEATEAHRKRSTGTVSKSIV
ncbi:MAG: hypothetical protein Q9195_004374 [Heterodermia aff. obscurata]